MNFDLPEFINRRRRQILIHYSPEERNVSTDEVTKRILE